MTASIRLALLLAAAIIGHRRSIPAFPRPTTAQPIEGTWFVVAWRVGADTLRVPRVGGYWSLEDGKILWNVRRADGRGSYELNASAHYSVTDSTFSYGYDRALAITRDSNGRIGLRDSLPFEGARHFHVTRGSGWTRYLSDNGRNEFLVRGDTAIISQDGALNRIYVRSLPEWRMRRP